MKFEINMINVEDGDCIILQLIKKETKALIVIDGGYKKHYPKLKKRIDELLPEFENKIDLIICSHYDNDHLEGISLLLDDCHSNGIEIKEIWMHKIEDTLTELSSGMNEKLRIETEKNIPYRNRNRELIGINSEIESFVHADNYMIENYKFLQGLIRKMIDYNLEGKIKEVTQGAFLNGFEEFHVVSPTDTYYNNFLSQLKEEKFLSDVKKTVSLILEESSGEKSIDEQITDTFAPCERLEVSSMANGVTPTNMVSIVTMLKTDGLKLLFTADSGIESYQTQGILNGDLNNLDWLQLPHHGSKNNTSKIMLDCFNPKIVFVSGKGGENRPSSTIIKCLRTKDDFQSCYVTNEVENTWYLKIGNDLKPERVIIPS